MFAAFFITFREVLEASLIVATILGILTKLNQKKEIKTVWLATAAAALASVLLLGIGSLLGIKVQEFYEQKEAVIEGTLMTVSAIFITWAVFFLHKYFAGSKAGLFAKIKNNVEKQEEEGIFVLVFAAVFREGIEIVLFLTTIYLSSNPQSVLTGFTLGMAAAVAVSLGLFRATLKLPVVYAFRVTNLLLILFAGGLLIRGVGEFSEAGFLPEIGKITFAFIPPAGSFAGDIVNAIFGFSPKMDFIQLILYCLYLGFMTWWVFGRKNMSLHSREKGL